MEQPVSFDTEDYIRQMRGATERSLNLARATVTDPVVLAGIEAQYALSPALECFARVHIGLREAGRDQNFIAAVAGALAGMIMDSVLLNSPRREDARIVFVNNMARAVSGESRFGEGHLCIYGRPAGRA